MLADQINAGARRVPVWALYAVGGLPFAYVVWLALTNGLGPEPVGALERDLGLQALRLLILTLCVSPLRRFAGVNLIRFRRPLGVLTFVYAALHLTVWVTLDLSFRWTEIGADLTKRPFIIAGMVAFVLMIPLTLTSNNASVRRLGAALWQRLHKATYAVAVLAALHFILLSKVWTGELVVYTAVVGLLLIARLIPKARQRVAPQQA